MRSSMSAVSQKVLLKPMVRFREFPFGTREDPSMKEFMRVAPWESQSEFVAYLRCGLSLGIPMGGNLTDWFDRERKANVEIDDQMIGGVSEMTDGIWFWPAGLIYFIERYNVIVPDEVIDHAREQNWKIDRDLLMNLCFETSYFEGNR